MESLAYSALRSPVVQEQAVSAVTFNALSWSAIGSVVSVVLTSTTLPAAAIVGQGATCSDVVQDIQKALTARNYNVGGIDGVFGTNTYNAVLRFQQAEALQADGVVGVRTAEALGLSGEVYAAGTNCATPIATNAPNPNPPSSTATGGKQQYTVTAEALNVRSEPDLTAAVVEILFRDARVEAIATDSG